MNRTMFAHPTTKAKIKKCVENVFQNGYSVDHLRNRKGDAYLAFRVHEGLLEITDKAGNNVTWRVIHWYKNKSVTGWK